MRRIFLVLAVLSQSGCAAAIYAESRNVTRAGITPPLATLMPAVPTDPAADCVMRGLTQGELLSLPNSGTLDDPAKAETFVKGVMARPKVVTCVGAIPKVAA